MNLAEPRDAVDYLLGLLPEEERDRQRERVVADPEEFARLRDVENELFDAYARNALSPRDRAAFERTLLRQPGARAKLQAARALAPPAQVPGEPARFTPSRPRRYLWWALAAAAVCAGAFLIRPSEPALAPASVQTGPMQTGPIQTAPLPAAAIVATQSFHLTAIARSGAVVNLRLDPATTAVSFSAEVPAGARLAEYEVAVLRRGAVVWSGVAAITSGQLRWQTPRLGPGAYETRIGPAATPLAFYEFTVE